MFGQLKKYLSIGWRLLSNLDSVVSISGWFGVSIAAILSGSIAWLSNQPAIIIFTISLAVFVLVSIFLMVFIGYRNTNKQISEEFIETQPLDVSLEPPNPGKHTATWIVLRVTNKSAYPVKGCYGKIISYEPLDESCQAYLPRRGAALCWSFFSGSGILKDIAGKSFELLDIAGVQNENSSHYFTASVPDSSGITSKQFPLPAGDYEVIIAVGSKEESFPPTTVRIKIHYQGGIKLTAEYMNEIGEKGI